MRLSIPASIHPHLGTPIAGKLQHNEGSIYCWTPAQIVKADMISCDRLGVSLLEAVLWMLSPVST